MRTADHQGKSNGPGRPSNQLLEKLKLQVWLYEIGVRTGKGSGYALEKHFEPNKVVYDPVEGVTRRPCKYDKYLKLKFLPNSDTRKLVEAQLPATRQLLEHPFWDVIRTPQASIEDLYNQLARLRPKISNLLFHAPTKTQRIPFRREQSLARTIQALLKHSDWDALTAAIGLIQESEYLGRPWSKGILVQPARLIFLRCFTRPSFQLIRREMFAYLRENFFYIRDSQDIPGVEDWNELLDTMNLDGFLYLRVFILLVIGDLELLKYCDPVPLSCLEIAEKYFTDPVVLEAWPLHSDGRLSEIQSMPAIKKLKRALRRWEGRHTSGFDIRNRRSH